MDRITFKQFLAEKFYNVFTADEKKKYADQVWDILVASYKNIGGLAGIDSKEDMIQNIAMWKVAVKDGKVLAAILYKDKEGGHGRKLVAVGTDNSKEGKDLLRNTLKHEFTRSFMEVSGPFYKFMDKHYPDLVKQYTISPEQASKILDREVTPTKDGWYKRKIQGSTFEKIMLGTPGKQITR